MSIFDPLNRLFDRITEPKKGTPAAQQKLGTSPFNTQGGIGGAFERLFSNFRNDEPKLIAPLTEQGLETVRKGNEYQKEFMTAPERSLETILDYTVRPVPRSLASIASSLQPTQASEALKTQQESDPLARALLGRDEVVPLVGNEETQGRTGRTEQDLESFGLPKSAAKIAGAPLALAGTLLDAVPGVGGSVPEGKILGDIAEGIAKSTTAKEIAPLLDDAVRGAKLKLAANDIPLLAKQLETVSDPIEAASVIQRASDANEARQIVRSNIDLRKAAEKGEAASAVDKFKRMWNTFNRKIVDDVSVLHESIRRAEAEAGIKTMAPDNLERQINLTRKFSGPAEAFMRNKGFYKVIQDLDRTQLDELDQYLIAKRSLELEPKGINTGRNMVSDQKIVDALGSQYEQYAQQVSKYSQDLLDYSVDTGLISKSLANSLKKEYPNYVPMNRVFSELELDEASKAFGKGNSVASQGSQDVVKKIVGSDRQVANPFKSLIDKTYTAFRQGERNRAARMLAEAADIPGNPMGIKAMDPSSKADPKDYFTAMIDGNPVRFEAPREIIEAAKNLDPETMNVMMKILSYPNRVFKLGTTGIRAAFALPNLAADTVFGFINSPAGTASLLNPVTFMRAWAETIGGGKVFDELVDRGVIQSSFDLTRAKNIEKGIDEIKAAKDFKSKVKFTTLNPKNWMRGVEDLISVTERGTRVHQYMATYNTMIGRGMSPEDAKVLAELAAENSTINFLRAGTWGRNFNLAIPYLNSGIQGSKTFLRALADRPVQTASRTVVSILAPTAALTAWNLSDPKRKEIYDDIADYEKENNFIMVLPGAHKNEDGIWEGVIKIKTPPGINNFGNILRQFIENGYDEDPVNFGRILKDLVGVVSPIEPTGRSLFSTATPQLIKPGLQQLTNQDFFSGTPVVPRELQNVANRLQVRDSTSGTVEAIANFFNISPIRAEKFMKDTFGGISESVFNLTDNALVALGALEKEDVGGRNAWNAVRGRFTSARGDAVKERLYDMADDIKKEYGSSKLETKNLGKSEYQRLTGLPKDQANAEYRKLEQSNPEVAKVVKDLVTKNKAASMPGSADAQIISGLSSNKEKATFVFQRANDFKTREEKNAYIKRLQDQGVITEGVIRYLKEMIASGNK